MTDSPSLVHTPGTPRAHAFHGRRKGKALRRNQADLFAGLLPRLALDLAVPAADLAALFPHPVRHVRLEIGFGGGEHLLARAEAEPDVGFIGVEPFRAGMAKALAAIARGNHANIRLSDEDAVRVLPWLPEGGLARVDLLYPDPWPKRRQWHRRFVGPDTLARIARALAPGAAFAFASDIPSYVEWTLKHAAAEPRLKLEHHSAEPWPGWPGTRYEAKALREGRTPAYLTFRRT